MDCHVFKPAPSGPLKIFKCVPHLPILLFLLWLPLLQADPKRREKANTFNMRLLSIHTAAVNHISDLNRNG